MARTRFPAASAIGALVALLLLAGCTTATTPETAPTKVSPSHPASPAAPVEVSPAKPVAPVSPTPTTPAPELRPATILGSEETSAMFDNFTAYVRAVDGQVVAYDRNGWNTPVTVKSGARRVRVVFVRGVFSAQTEVTFTARPGAAYQLKFATDAQIFGKNSYCEFWIEDIKSGQKALQPTRVPLVRSESAN